MKKIKTITILHTRKTYTPINYILRLGHKLYGKSINKYEWLLPAVIFSDSSAETLKQDIENIIHEIKSNSIDVIAISVYVWNRLIYKLLCTKIKNECPGVTIIAGGPDLDAHLDTNFFAKNPWIDWVIYGEGEIAFTRLLDHLAGFESNLINTVESSGTIYPYEVFNDKHFLSYSPYITFKDDFSKSYYEYKKMLKDANKNSGAQQKTSLAWETTKGCPYSCTFCDWNQGLHNKVRSWSIPIKSTQKSKPTWQSELELFTKLGIKDIWWTNPNVGMGTYDKEIVDFWCQLPQKHIEFPKLGMAQLSKTKKRQAFELYDKLLSNGIIDHLKFDVQDLDSIVLENIDRPDMPWAEHKLLIKELINKYPTLVQFPRVNILNIFNVSHINFIWGLPGQTIEHWNFNFLETTRDLKIAANHFLFEILPAAPVANKEYQEKYKITTEKIFVLLAKTRNIDCQLEDIPDNDYGLYFLESNIVTSTYSLGHLDWFTGWIKQIVYIEYFGLILKNPDLYLKIFDYFEEQVNVMYQWYLKHKIVCLSLSGYKKSRELSPIVNDINDIMLTAYAEYH